MASSVPVVLKKDPSFENLIRHKETGFIFENDEDAADMLYYALTNKDEARRVAELGFDAIQSLSAKQYALDVEQVYRAATET